MHYNCCLVICAKKSIQSLFILDATFSIVNNNLSFHACWLHILSEMRDNILTNVIDSFFSGKECINACSSYQFVLVFLANLVGKLIKLLLQLSIVQMHFDWNSLEIKFKSGPICY